MYTTNQFIFVFQVPSEVPGSDEYFHFLFKVPSEVPGSDESIHFCI
jgi:hypothetical protein